MSTDGPHQSSDGRRDLRIAIVTPYGYLDSVSVLCDLAELLADRGDEVEIITDAWDGFTMPVFSNPRITLTIPFLLERPPAVPGAAKPRLRSVRARLRPIRPVVDAVQGTLMRRRIDAWMASHARERLAAEADWTLDYVIGVDPEGLRRAAVLARNTDAALVYWSLELMLSDELVSTSDRRLKELERSLSRKAKAVIIQDRQRAALLAADNSLPLEKFVLVPNAPLGPARRSNARYWHQRFGLPSGTRVLLHVGSLAAWTGVSEIIGASQQLPDGWVLIVHSRYDPAKARNDSVGHIGIEWLAQAPGNGKVIFSTQPVPRGELTALVDSADAGVAFYLPMPGQDHYVGKNIEVIGLSSGKVSGYLMSGLPVIVNDASTLGNLVQRERIGVSVASADELPGAVRQIEAAYEDLSQRAMAYFDRELDFRQGAKRIADCLDGRASP